MLKFKTVDKYHFEIDLHLEKEVKKNQLAIYFFIPKQLGIDQFNFSQNQFYQNLVSQQRFINRDQRLDSLSQLITHFNSLIDSPSMGSKTYRRELSRFISQFELLIRKKLQHLNQKYNARHIFLFTHRILQFVAVFRQMRPQNIQHAKRKSFRYLDNYLNLIVSQYFLQFRVILFKLNKDGRSDEWIEQLQRVIENEKKYSQQQNFREYENTHQGMSRWLDKRRLLKHYVDAPILLRQTKSMVGNFREQFIYSLAAAGAMSIATTIAFTTQQHFGNFSTPFFYALVLSYILKDRFKELSRNFVVKIIFKHTYAFKYKIEDTYQKHEIATAFDTCLLSSQKKLPIWLKSLIEKKKLVKGIDDYTILKYLRKTNIKTKNYPQNSYSLRNILSFNFFSMINNLPGEKRNIYIEENNKVIIKKEVTSYIIQILINDSCSAYIKHYKLLVNQKGIIQIESFSEKKINA